MRFIPSLRTTLVALAALVGVGLSSAAQADTGSIRFTVLKGGWVIGGSAGSGTLSFHGRSYRLSIGGISYGIVFGASQTTFSGRVSNIRRPSDVAGVYAAAGAGAALGVGAQVITLTNQNGAILTLTGRQLGLQINADLSGLALTLQ